MSWELSEVERKQTELFDNMKVVFDILSDLADWSREATHNIYHLDETHPSIESYVKVDGEDWDGPSEDYISSKAWEIVAILRG